MTIEEVKRRYEAIKTKYDSEKNNFTNSMQVSMTTLLSNVETCFSDLAIKKKQWENMIADLNQKMSLLDQNSALAIPFISGTDSMKQMVIDSEQEMASLANIILDNADAILTQAKSIGKDAKKKAEKGQVKQPDLSLLQSLLQNVPTELSQLEKEFQLADSKQKAEAQKRRDDFIRKSLQQFREQKLMVENPQTQFNAMQKMMLPILSFSINGMITALEQIPLTPEIVAPLSANAANPNAAQPRASVAKIMEDLMARMQIFASQAQSSDSKQREEADKGMRRVLDEGLVQLEAQAKKYKEMEDKETNPLMKASLSLITWSFHEAITESKKLKLRDVIIPYKGTNPNATQVSASAATATAVSAALPPNSAAASAQAKSEKDAGPKASAVINATSADVSSIATPNPTPSPAILHAASAAAKPSASTAATSSAASANAANVNAAPNAAAAKGVSPAVSKVKWKI